MTGDGAEAAARRESGWRDYAEDATGFGGAEWRTARDLMVRPRAVLDDYVAGGPTGFGRYARPTRFYLALCGVLMFYLFLIGGNQRLFDGLSPEALDPFAALAGKNRAGFIAAADNWIGFLAVPVLAFFYATAFAPLIRWWGGYRWRIGFRATLAMMCAWTVPMLAMGPLPYLDGFKLAAAIAIHILLIIAFVRMGRGVWWRTPIGAAGKALALIVVLQIGGILGMQALLVLAALAVRLAA